MPSSRTLDTLQLATLLLVALALIPAGAHLFELPSKMTLSRDQYMIVQNIYRGWAAFGIVIVGALALTVAHAVAVRANSAAMMLSLAAAACVAGSLIIFFAFTYPMNVASDNWTVVPVDFEAARRQWEYSHAANAMVMGVAFVFTALSILASRPTGGVAGAQTKAH
jgi:hypothetical protein